jgi:hypothetical protein
LQKIPESTPEVSVGRKKFLCKTNNFALKTQNFGFQKPEVSFEKSEVLVGKPEASDRKPEVSFPKPEVSVRKPEVSGKFFELETTVKVVFRNVSVADGNPKFKITVYHVSLVSKF